MRKNRIQVSSGTYCRALAQLERRMMSQMDLTKAERDWVEAMVLGFFCLSVFLSLGMGVFSAMSLFLFLKFFLGTFNLLNTLLWSWQILRHGSTQLFDSLAHLPAYF